MTILTSIQAIVKYHFGDYFENISEHYLNNLLILLQGLLSSRNSSISMVASDPLNRRAHTTLTRFLNHNDPFWTELEKCFCSAIFKPTNGKRIFVADDSLLDKCGKHIPFVSKAFDHCTNQFKNAQTILTIGEVLNGVFCPISILFAASKTKAKTMTKKSQQTSKNDMLVNWLKGNKGTNQVLIGDSWYTNSYVIEACQNWFHVPFIGQLKKNQKVKIGNQVMTVQTLIASAKLNRSVQVNDKCICYHSYEAFVQAIRHPVKIIVTELENGTQTALIASDTTLTGEDIILYYAQRWSIEVFFKLAKQHLGLGDCHLRSAAGQRHYMVLVSIAYLIFNDLKAFLLKQGQDNRNKAVLDFIRLSLSQLLVIHCVEVRLSFALLNSDPTSFLCRSPGLLQESLHSCTS